MTIVVEQYHYTVKARKKEYKHVVKNIDKEIANKYNINIISKIVKYKQNILTKQLNMSYNY